MFHWEWEMGPCAISVLACTAAAVCVIRRYEGSAGAAGGDGRRPGVVYDDQTWLPCFKTVHPAWLFVYRLTCSVLFTTLAVIAISGDHSLLYFYTWWTFLLVTAYFGLATGLSFYGCRKFDPEKSSDGQGGTRKIAGFWGYLLQVIYQTAAGAVMMTDFVFWLIIFPSLMKTDGYRVHFLTVMAHSFNLIFLLGDATLNSMSYPWFRMGYFLLWTCVYVLFQGTVHALSAITWWPYPFLNLSSRWAPLWYILAGLLQVPFYLIFTLALMLKRRIFTRWAPATFVHA